jgi:hypothetical protein
MLFKELVKLKLPAHPLLCIHKFGLSENTFRGALRATTLDFLYIRTGYVSHTVTDDVLVYTISVQGKYKVVAAH